MFFLTRSLKFQSSSTHPCRALEHTEDLLLCDGLVGGLRVGLGGWSEDGVDVGVNQRNQLGVDGRGRLTKLVIDPILECLRQKKII